jgi:hypothetical protein
VYTFEITDAKDHDQNRIKVFFYFLYTVSMNKVILTLKFQLSNF